MYVNIYYIYKNLKKNRSHYLFIIVISSKTDFSAIFTALLTGIQHNCVINNSLKE